MSMPGKLDAIMKWPLVYTMWMSPFASQKFEPIIAHNDMRNVRRVLDVGCGPGTDARQFAAMEYLGIDQNDRYVSHARRRYGRRFEVVDVTRLEVSIDQRYDFILINSLLHHIDTESTRRLLAHLPNLLSEGGHVHVIELVLPPRLSLPRLLARADRGEFPRPISGWRELFCESFEEVVFEPFDVCVGGIVLWNMVYFKGCSKQRDTRMQKNAETVSPSP
jgi:SAM-dependent methyltransferase